MFFYRHEEPLSILKHPIDNDGWFSLYADVRKPFPPRFLFLISSSSFLSMLFGGAL